MGFLICVRSSKGGNTEWPKTSDGKMVDGGEVVCALEETLCWWCDAESAINKLKPDNATKTRRQMIISLSPSITSTSTMLFTTIVSNGHCSTSAWNHFCTPCDKIPIVTDYWGSHYLMTHHPFLDLYVSCHHMSHYCITPVFDVYLSIVSITYSLTITNWVAMAT